MNSSKYIEYTASYGDSISKAAVEAVRIARENRQEVMLKFNDASIVVKADQSPQDVIQSYSDERAAIGKAYRAAPAALDEKSREDAIAADLAKVVRELVLALPEALERGLTETVKWVGQYSVSARHTATDPQAEKVLNYFKSSGYQANEFSGDQFIPNDKEVFGRYIVGQVMRNLEANGRPPQVAYSFAKTYLSLPDGPSEPSDRERLGQTTGVRTQVVGDTKYWYLNDRLHRTEGPAVEGPQGAEEWYLNGKRHCDEGPAVRTTKGDRQWWIDGTQFTEQGFLKRREDPKAAALREEAAGNFFQEGTSGTGTVIRPKQPKP